MIWKLILNANKEGIAAALFALLFGQSALIHGESNRTLLIASFYNQHEVLKLSCDFDIVLVCFDG